MANLRRVLLAMAGAAVLAAGVATASVVGVVTAVSKRDVTVAGAVYPIDESVALEDLAGQPIKLSEIRPGTSVELEFDEEGRLTRIRAAVVR